MNDGEQIPRLEKHTRGEFIKRESEKMIGSVPCGECEMRVSRTNAFVAAPFSLSFSAAHANQPQPIVLIYDCLHHEASGCAIKPDLPP